MNKCNVFAGGLIAVDPPLKMAIQTIQSVAPRPNSVLIVGPTGVGKDGLARLAHDRSGRRGPFVALNCATLNNSLTESTLFGHVRGAFTGALAETPGAFLEAHEGTLFLDEVGELDGAVQAKLLRVLEERAVRALGASRSTPVDVRIIAATNRNLRDGAFRLDLYFRLATFVVQVPPLRERPGDLLALIRHFHSLHERAERVRLARRARALLLGYPWPGNVRELRNVIDRVLTLAPEGELHRDHLLTLAPELHPGDLAETQRSSRKARAAREDAAIRAWLASGKSAPSSFARSLGINRTTLWRRAMRLEPKPRG